MSNDAVPSSASFVVKTSQGFLVRRAEKNERLQIGSRNYAVGFGPRLSEAIYFGKKENAETVAELVECGNPGIIEAPLVMSFDEAVLSLVEFYKNMNAKK